MSKERDLARRFVLKSFEGRGGSVIEVGAGARDTEKPGPTSGSRGGTDLRAGMRQTEAREKEGAALRAELLRAWRTI